MLFQEKKMGERDQTQETCSNSNIWSLTLTETTGNPFCFVHEFMSLFTGSPDPSSNAAHKSSVFAFEQANFFIYEASDLWFTGARKKIIKWHTNYIRIILQMSKNWLIEFLNPMKRFEQLSHILQKMIGWQRWTIKE